MNLKQIIFNIFLVLTILLISEVAVSSESTRAHYLSKLGISSQSIQSLQNLEAKLLKDFKVSNAAEMKSKRIQTQENQSESRQTKLKLKKVASVYNKALKKHLMHNQIAGYMSYLNASRELIHIPGGFYSPYVLGSFIRL